MGGVANKCAELDKGSDAAKPLDGASSEEEGEDEDEEEDDEVAEAEQARLDAERALGRRLVRGQTEAFEDDIAEAKAVGVGEDMIVKAEAILEQHKAGQR